MRPPSGPLSLMPSSPQAAFVYTRSIRFHETDAAGVVYFANVLVLCHEAYEASLAAAGIDLGEFFSDPDRSFLRRLSPSPTLR